MDVPSYMLDKKNWRKKFQIFFIFHRGDPYDFSKKISQKIFLKNHKGPPYEKWKKYEIFFFNFFCPTCSLGHPKMPVRSFFEKSLTNFECVLFVRPRILTTSPFCNVCEKIIEKRLKLCKIFAENPSNSTKRKSYVHKIVAASSR